MMNGILILISVLAFSVNGIMTRTFQTKLQKSKHSINLYQTMFTFVASLAYFALSIVQGIPFSTHLLVPAALFGICFACAVLFLAKCMEMGYMSLSSVIVNLSLILPVIFSWLIMREEVKINSIIGLLLIIITLVLSSFSAEKNGSGNLKKWLLFVIIAFIANGGSAIVQKQYKASFGESDLMLFMAFAYLISSLIFTVTYVINNLKSDLKLREQIKNPALLPILAIVSGLGSFGGNGLLGYLCDKVNGGILYPCVNGGLSIVLALSSFIIFKEKLNKKKIAAIVTGVAAIVLLNI